MFVLDTQSKMPIFEQLKKQILLFISIGVLSPNDKLPSVRNLAMELGVNPNTISRAYQELEEQGYIYTEKGKGCFVSDNGADKTIKEWKLKNFSHMVEEMKAHHIQMEELMSVIKQCYQEVNEDA